MSKMRAFTLIAPALLTLALGACSAPDTWSVDERTVYFETGKSKLNNDARGKLDSLAANIHRSSNVEGVTITGFADRQGSPAANQVLSQRRANAVKGYLAAKGVAGHIGNTGWVGESQSTTVCEGKDTSSCLTPDRKVEVTVNYTPREISSGTNRILNNTTFIERNSNR
jgi:outer membrane protein OmpA-like peptidoglycan-associated protein